MHGSVIFPPESETATDRHSTIPWQNTTESLTATDRQPTTPWQNAILEQFLTKTVFTHRSNDSDPLQFGKSRSGGVMGLRSASASAHLQRPTPASDQGINSDHEMSHQLAGAQSQPTMKPLGTGGGSRLAWHFLILMIGVLSTLIPYTLKAQEFSCTVTVNSQQISGSAYEYVSELKPLIETYLNETKWTERRYEEVERIRCDLQIIFTSATPDFSYQARFVASLRRPIYNSLQQSQTLLLSDDTWQFSYPRGKTLLRDDLQYDALTTFIDFYAFLFLGFDEDTFSELGGTTYFNRAKTLQELAEVAGGLGWGRAVGAQRNRFGMVRDLTNPAYDEFRKAQYLYHRKGLDTFIEDPVAARRQVMDAIRLVQSNSRTAPNPYLFDIFFATKVQELVSIFQDATSTARTEAALLFKSVNPGNSSTYDRLIQ